MYLVQCLKQSPTDASELLLVVSDYSQQLLYTHSFSIRFFKKQNKNRLFMIFILKLWGGHLNKLVYVSSYSFLMPKLFFLYFLVPRSHLKNKVWVLFKEQSVVASIWTGCQAADVPLLLTHCNVHKISQFCYEFVSFSFSACPFTRVLMGFLQHRIRCRVGGL
jgi:hypothetical protein